jgi:hypothetical protein
LHGEYGTPQILTAPALRGVDWGDAAIGAAGGLGLSGSLAAGAATASPRRRWSCCRDARHTAHRAAGVALALVVVAVCEAGGGFATLALTSGDTPPMCSV